MSNDKIKITNTSGSTVSFNKLESNGTVILNSGMSTRSVTNDELDAQISSGNVLFVGLDGHGSHAWVYIDDAEYRKKVGFENSKEEVQEALGNGEEIPVTQNILTDEKLKSLFAVKTLTTFSKKMKEYVVTTAEKDKLANYVIDNNINDLDKVKAVEVYTGKKIVSE